MKQIQVMDKSFEEENSVWITLNLKTLSGTLLSCLAAEITDAEILDVLADVPNVSTKLQVAKSEYTSSKTLEKLSNDELLFIREEVAKHKNTSQETLLKLSNPLKEKEISVRVEVALNPNTPKSTLVLMLFDPQSAVVIATVRNPVTPEENIKMIQDTKDPMILYAIKQRLKKE